MTVDIIIFALIAIYILIKLYNIIGSDGFGPDAKPAPKPKGTVVINLAKDVDYNIVDEVRNIDNEAEKKILASLPKDLLDKVEEIKQRDKSFLLSKFLSNSEKAFELIIAAFASYDVKTINLLTMDSALENFSKSLKEQKALNHNINIDIVSVLEKSITDISIKSNICHISVSFLTEQIFYITDQEKQIVKGDRSQIEKIEDKWVFRKNLKSSDLIWHVVKTQS